MPDPDSSTRGPASARAIVSEIRVVGASPAVEDLTLVRVGPSVAGDTGTGEVHDGIHATEVGRVERAVLRIPADLARVRDPSNDGDDVVALAEEPRPQRAADQTARTRDRDTHQG